MNKTSFEERCKMMVDIEQNICLEIEQILINYKQKLENDGLKCGVLLWYMNYKSGSNIIDDFTRPPFKEGYLSNIYFYICRNNEDPKNPDLNCLNIGYTLCVITKSLFQKLKIYRYGWDIELFKNEIITLINQVLKYGYEETLKNQKPSYERKKIKNIEIK